jgi:hypothetical protein
MSENVDIERQGFITGINENTTGAEFEVDPAGDFFGDYNDCISDEMGMDYLDSNVSDDESEGTVDEEYILTNESETTEPERVPPSDSFLSYPLPDIVNPDDANPTTASGSITNASRLRGGAEEVLQKRPFVVKFTKGRAGATYATQQVEGDNLNASYRHNVANGENPSPYSPFSSKLEWEIVHWAKMRGPSSTAFNELIQIEGVSVIQFVISSQATHTLS